MFILKMLQLYLVRPLVHGAKLQQLQKEKDAHRTQLFERLERREADDRYLNSTNRTNDEEEAVGTVKVRVVPPWDESEKEGVDTNHVQHEDVTTPTTKGESVG